MQTFSELQATKVSLCVSLGLTPINLPNLEVTVDKQCRFKGILQYDQIFVCDHDILEPLHIEIKLHDKIYDAQEQAVLISSMQVDRIDYSDIFATYAVYQNDHDYSGPTTYLGFNGTWSIMIDRPFYQWLHEKTGQGWLLEPGI